MQDNKDTKQVLGEKEQARYESLMRACRRHGDWPLQASLEAFSSTDCVVVRHSVGIVQGLVDEWPMNKEFGIIVARAKEGDLDVEEKGVTGRYRVEIRCEHEGSTGGGTWC